MYIRLLPSKILLFSLATLFVCFIACLNSPPVNAGEEPVVKSSLSDDHFVGKWDAAIECPGGAIRFGIDLQKKSGQWSAYLVNGTERIEVPIVNVGARSVTLNIDHYDSKIELALDSKTSRERFVGTWKKRRGPSEWVEMKCSAVRHDEAKKLADPAKMAGRWSVNFQSSKDPAVAVFKQAKDSNQLLGTFLTATGDYRFLAGEVKDQSLELSCFDGAHAFLFKASLDDDQALKGDFWSSSTWHENWTATFDPDAKLPDDFKQTTANSKVELGDLSFPDLDGHQTKLDDQKFAGKARIIYVFGSWCPNCHDAGEYFASLEKKYGDKGLSILGLAFELTGEFGRDSEQVKKYLKRHGSSYPVLVAGIADKADASKRLPILDRVRSYPTTIFLDGQGNVKAVHTGFTGPATGKSYKELKSKFESLIEACLAN